MTREIVHHRTPSNLPELELYADEGINQYTARAPLDLDILKRFAVHLPMQNGPIGEVGINGLTNEVLLAIVIDRLQHFQSGKYHCVENDLALVSAQNALFFLKARTRDRLRRGVEGVNAP